MSELPTVSKPTTASSFSVRPEHVRAQAAAVLQKSRSGVVAIQVASPWAGPEFLNVAEDRWPLVYCPSALAIREALTAHDATNGLPLIILTPVSDDQLGWDVKIRLAKGRVIAMEPWAILMDLFRARGVDPRVSRFGWMAEALLANMPAGGYSPTPSGMLDADTAWTHALNATLGLQTGRPDAQTLLVWSAQAGAAHRFVSLGTEARAAIVQRISESAGVLGELFGQALQAGNGALLMPIGLACEVLFPADGSASSDLDRAAVRLERYLNDTSVTPEVARRWARTALGALDELSSSQAQASCQQADKLLRDLRAEEFIIGSSALPEGLGRRLEEFGRSLMGFVTGSVLFSNVQQAHSMVAAHRRAQDDSNRLERLGMALRLARFLDGHRSGSTSPTPLSALAQSYASEWSYVDWARTMLLGGDVEPELTAAFEALFARVRKVREDVNRRFASVLADWSRLSNREPGAIPVEHILETCAAPLAAEGPVLVLLLDGTDFVVFRQLLEDLRDRGWEQWVPEDVQAPPVGLAVVPSVTAFSRASFFAGHVSAGIGADESRSFASNAALLAASKPKRPPRLFHKGDLVGETTGGLADDVQAALRDTDQRVVGVVVNAVDDFLAKSDQVRARWTVDHIPLLNPILSEANLAGRVVLLASDHGHVLEAGTVALPAGTDERWRPYAEPIADEEVVFEGQRVSTATGLPKVVVPWSETVRYTRRKAGYHGGATPQEVVVPIAVLAPWDRALGGYRAVPDTKPAWWSELEAVVAPSPTPAAPQKARKRAAPAQPSLFAEPQSTTASAVPGWIAALLHSDTYRAQRERAGRIAPPDTTVRQILEALEAHKGRAPRSVVARAVAQPEIRLRGIMAGLQRVLNVEGYPIVTVDEATGTVELQRELLRKQFQIGA
jgi:hypothetical protein